MTLRNPRRETVSSHSEAPLGNSRCRASSKAGLPASSSSERQYSGPVFFGLVVRDGGVDSLADGAQVELLGGADVFEFDELRSVVCRHSGNGAVPTGLVSFLAALPALPCRAFTFCRYAAGFVSGFAALP